MTTLTMGYGRVAPMTRDVDVINSTTQTVDNDAPVQMADRAPDRNEFVHSTVDAGGLSTNLLASHVTPSLKSPPITGNSGTDFAGPINSQIATSGTAAQREASGEWGHGTLQITEGIEPTIVDGTQFNESYFAAHKVIPNGPTGDYMTPPLSDAATTAANAQVGASRAMSAQLASMYNAFNDARTR